jgi:hypothetical protein
MSYGQYQVQNIQDMPGKQKICEFGLFSYFLAGQQ